MYKEIPTGIAVWMITIVTVGLDPLADLGFPLFVPILAPSSLLSSLR